MHRRAVFVYNERQTVIEKAKKRSATESKDFAADLLSSNPLLLQLLTDNSELAVNLAVDTPLAFAGGMSREMRASYKKCIQRIAMRESA